MENNKYKFGQISRFVKVICQDNNLDYEQVATKLLSTFPELKNKKKCVNCGASMAIRSHSIDAIDTLLLLGMSKIVDQRLKKNMSFTEANQVHIPRELGGYYSVQSRQSWCRELGLIAKVMRSGTNVQKSGTWCITKRGFEFLAGKPVPQRVSTFRNKIQERFPETITIGEVLSSKTNSIGSKEFDNYKDIDFKGLEFYAVNGYSQGTLNY